MINKDWLSLRLAEYEASAHQKSGIKDRSHAWNGEDSSLSRSRMRFRLVSIILDSGSLGTGFSGNAWSKAESAARWEILCSVWGFISQSWVGVSLMRSHRRRSSELPQGKVGTCPSPTCQNPSILLIRIISNSIILRISICGLPGCALVVWGQRRVEGVVDSCNR